MISGRALSAGEFAVTRHLLMHGPATRADLGDRLNLSYASMSRAARALIEGGMAAETVQDEPAVGRPRQILTAVPTARHVVGCKLTGDKAYAVVCDLFGEVKATASAALPPASALSPPAAAGVPVAGVQRVITGLVTRLSRRVPSVDAVGVALGGVVSGRTLVREGTFLGWRDVDLGAPLRDRLGLPVTVTNDVTALAREQLWFGAGRSHATFGVVTVGAGLGFGVVREGAAVEELIDNGHLLAHAPVDPRGPRCRLGHAGCVAAYLSRSDIERRVGAGRAVTFAGLISARAGGDRAAWKLLDGAARALGHLIATFAGALQSTCIVLAGEDAAALVGYPVLAEVVAERLRPGPDEAQRCSLEIVTTPLTFTDWARGAAVAGIQHLLGDG